jgi:threonine/homoserine/homoserine lactone efflux protein
MHALFKLFLQGLMFGFAMAAIPGPIFFLIVQRTLAEGPLTGFFCGLGAATADFIYAFIAVIGLTFIMQFLISHQMALSLLGGLFIIYLGIKTFLRVVVIQKIEVVDTRLFTAWLSTLLLTLANPVTIGSYCILFASLGISQQPTLNTLISLLMGVATGALLVILVLIIPLSFFRQRISVRKLMLLNQTAGIILICFGVMVLFRGFDMWYRNAC